MLDATGLIHMNGRVYDPIVGRFMSADPTVPDSTDAQNDNRYSYVLNNPNVYTDPSGFAQVREIEIPSNMNLTGELSAMGLFGSSGYQLSLRALFVFEIPTFRGGDEGGEPGWPTPMPDPFKCMVAPTPGCFAVGEGEGDGDGKVEQGELIQRLPAVTIVGRRENSAHPEREREISVTFGFEVSAGISVGPFQFGFISGGVNLILTSRWQLGVQVQATILSPRQSSGVFVGAGWQAGGGYAKGPPIKAHTLVSTNSPTVEGEIGLFDSAGVSLQFDEEGGMSGTRGKVGVGLGAYAGFGETSTTTSYFWNPPK